MTTAEMERKSPDAMPRRQRGEIRTSYQAPTNRQDQQERERWLTVQDVSRLTGMTGNDLKQALREGRLIGETKGKRAGVRIRRPFRIVPPVSTLELKSKIGYRRGERNSPKGDTETAVRYQQRAQEELARGQFTQAAGSCLKACETARRAVTLGCLDRDNPNSAQSGKAILQVMKLVDGYIPKRETPWKLRDVIANIEMMRREATDITPRNTRFRVKINSLFVHEMDQLMRAAARQQERRLKTWNRG